VCRVCRNRPIASHQDAHPERRYRSPPEPWDGSVGAWKRVISTGLKMVRMALSERLGLLMKRVPHMGTMTPCGERRSLAPWDYT